MQRFRVFISYSRDYSPNSEQHREWVAALADALQRESDIEVVFDEYELYAGKDLTKFMEQVAAVDRVVIVLTPEYARRANERHGGVGYESSILSALSFQGNSEDRFIPVLRGDPRNSIPSYLRSKVYVDMRDRSPDEPYELLRAIRQQPGRARPPRQRSRLLPPVADIAEWLKQFSGMVEITDIHCEPLSVERGRSISLRYRIVNNKGECVKAWLGASVLPDASGEEYYNVEQDSVVMLHPGEGTYARELTVPQVAPPGMYRVVCAVYLEQLPDVRLDRRDLGYILSVY